MTAAARSEIPPQQRQGPANAKQAGQITLLKRSERVAPKVSLVLLDWSVRESMHLFHYLKNQNVPRDAFETIVVEYYATRSPAVEEFAEEVDTWALLGMPQDCYYHKHLMYNAGIVLSRGTVVMIGDSDAMVTPRFIDSIVAAFDKGDQVLHIDQFRNNRRDLYPFCYPSFEEVLGPGCINNVGGRTAGVVDVADPIHTRNYGACMCAPRDALISIGGADEHIDYLGHICGPYDMTFRLVNAGLPEHWHDSEFTYHTWHPGQAGGGNYLGPHDGRHMSTTALNTLVTGRVMPLVENPAIRMLREGSATSEGALLDALIDTERLESWLDVTHDAQSVTSPAVSGPVCIDYYLGHEIYQDGLRYCSIPRAEIFGSDNGAPRFESDSRTDLLKQLRRSLPAPAKAVLALVELRAGAAQIRELLRSRLGRWARRASGEGAPPTTIEGAKNKIALLAGRMRNASEATAQIYGPLLQARRADTSALHDALIVVSASDRHPLKRVLTKLRALPAHEVAQVASTTDVVELLNAASDKRTIFVGRGVYTRYYVAFAGAKDRLNIIVL